MFGGVLSDHVCDEGDVEIIVDGPVRYIPWCACDSSQCFRLKSLQDFDIKWSRAAPQLYAIGPNGSAEHNNEKSPTKEFKFEEN
jgi:hypothetical protein